MSRQLKMKKGHRRTFLRAVAQLAATRALPTAHHAERWSASDSQVSSGTPTSSVADLTSAPSHERLVVHDTASAGEPVGDHVGLPPGASAGVSGGMLAPSFSSSASIPEGSVAPGDAHDTDEGDGWDQGNILAWPAFDGVDSPVVAPASPHHDRHHHAPRGDGGDGAEDGASTVSPITLPAGVRGAGTSAKPPVAPTPVATGNYGSLAAHSSGSSPIKLGESGNHTPSRGEAGDARKSEAKAKAKANRSRQLPGPLASLGHHLITFDELNFQEKVGEGSFGVVRRAVWRGMQVAVKELKLVEVRACVARAGFGCGCGCGVSPRCHP